LLKYVLLAIITVNVISYFTNKRRELLKSDSLDLVVLLLNFFKYSHQSREYIEHFESLIEKNLQTNFNKVKDVGHIFVFFEQVFSLLELFYVK